MVKTGPTFLFIGPSKSGSTWIYEALKDHPEIFVPPAKDLQFFEKYYHHGFEWYLQFFRNGKNKKVRGEISHSYIESGETAQRIFDAFPDIQLFACLRDPVERLVSGYHHARALYLDNDISFEEFISCPELLQSGRYYQNLTPFYRLFPRERILIMFYDELKADPSNFLFRLFSFLGADPCFKPECLNRKVLVARAPRNVFLAHLGYKIGAGLRARGCANLVGRVKHNTLFESLLYRPVRKKITPPPEILSRLGKDLLNEADKLEELIERELPPSWFETTK